MCCFSFLNFVDTDECSTVSPCHANATCNNTEGSYTCTCDSGYSGDGSLCNGRKFFWFNKVTIEKIYLKKVYCNILCCFSFPNFADRDECLTVSPCHGNPTCNNTIKQ